MNEQLINALQALVLVAIGYATLACLIALTTLHRERKARKIKRERELERLIKEVESRSKVMR
jgi:hypothetical protein